VIGAVPPLAFADWRYAVTAVVASLAIFWLHPHLYRLRRTVIPVVLRREIYAVVALGGAVGVSIVEWAGVRGPLPLAAAAVLMTGVRLIALRRRWSAPVAVP
jgi:uncharacterized membrane protein YeiH